MAEMIATRSAYGKALVSLGARRNDVVVLDADLSKSTMTAEFAKAFPDRFVQMGISEQDMMATAAGLAAAGKVAYASTFAVFAAGRAFEQVRNSVCYPQLDVKVCATHAGLTVGDDGGSHQAIEDIALMRVLPNMKVFVPSDATVTEWIVKQAAEVPGPVYVRLGRLPVPVLYQPDQRFEVGRAATLRNGNDVAIIACGLMVSKALEAADILIAQGIEARVIDMFSIKPLDLEAIACAAADCGAIVTAEEHSIIGGLGGAVAEAVTSAGKCVPVERTGVADKFGKSGKPDQLLEAYGLTAESVAQAALRCIARARGM
jgi:transketolase